MIIWLASYPRSGNTLTTQIFSQVFGTLCFEKYNNFQSAIKKPGSRGYAELGLKNFQGTWENFYKQARASSKPVLIKTHDAPEDDSPCIYIVRNGLKATESYYHFCRRVLDQTVSWEDIVTGSLPPFPGWGSHLDAWQPFRREKTLLVRYDDLAAGNEETLSQLAEMTTLPRVAAWENHFAEHSKRDPGFFRKGNSDPGTGIPESHRRLFEFLNGDWMNRLGFGKGLPESPAQPAARALMGRRPESQERVVVELRDQKARATREQVIWCYQSILGRQPEDDAVVQQWVKTNKGFASMVKMFIDSAEFQQIRQDSAQKKGARFLADVSDQNEVLGVISALEPQTVSGFSKNRIGRDHDGGYVMLDDFSGIAAAYSLGISDDVSWDLVMAGKGIEIFQYDHTIEALPLEHPKFHWWKKGIGTQTLGDFVTLKDAVDGNGHSSRTDLLLKCDIEGAEWGMLESVQGEELACFKQIVIELHCLGRLEDVGFRTSASRAVANLTRHHAVVHVHANNCGEVSLVAGIPLPMYVELTLVRRRDYALSPSMEIFPTALDRPCLPDYADILLGAFRFK